jgi:hypothetical protein
MTGRKGRLSSREVRNDSTVGGTLKWKGGIKHRLLMHGLLRKRHGELMASSLSIISLKDSSPLHQFFLFFQSF